jgi:flavocytochrome c
MEITYALMSKLEEIAEKEPSKVRIITRARAQKLLTNESGAVIGVEFEKGGSLHKEYGPVVVATGGYAAGNLDKNSLLAKVRPDLMHLPTTNGIHCTGDGIQMGQAIGASCVDLKYVQVHPTGLVHFKDQENPVKFLAAEALLGVGAIILDKNGKRFVDELNTRDYVTAHLWKNQGPFRLVLNTASAKEIEWHCKHYVGRSVMRKYNSAADLAKDMGISPSALEQTFNEYNGFAKKKNDPFGRKFFDGAPYEMKDVYHAAIITPVLHYCMGGLEINDRAEVISEKTRKPIPGLYAAGEASGGVHGKNRLGGSALLECVVFGRVAGGTVSQYVKEGHHKAPGGAAPAGGVGGNVITINVPQASGSNIVITISSGGASVSGGAGGAPAKSSGLPPADSADGGADSTGEGAKKDEKKSGGGDKKEGGGQKEYSLEEVSKHTSDKDCWVVINGQVLNVTSFLDDHPGGKMAIMTFAGRDASEEFNMLHDKGVIAKYAPNTIIGTVKPKSKL